MVCWKWLKAQSVEKGYIDQGDFDAIEVTDDLDKIVDIAQRSIMDSAKSHWLMKERR